MTMYVLLYLRTYIHMHVQAVCMCVCTYYVRTLRLASTNVSGKFSVNYFLSTKNIFSKPNFVDSMKFKIYLIKIRALRFDIF